jgi:membrane-anchored protein YejM (alkaline phosphatase superfamily)
MPSDDAIMPTYLLDSPTVCYQRRVIVRAEFNQLDSKHLPSLLHTTTKTQKALLDDANVRCIPLIIVAIVTWFKALTFAFAHNKNSQKNTQMTQNNTTKHNKRYCGMMRCIDTTVSTVMTAVSAAGFSDNTLVIFTGDNGGAPKYAD